MRVPELPDVEGFRRTLADHAVGRRIRGVEVHDSGVLRGIGARALDEALRGHRFREPGRHGKWLLAGTDGPTVLLHFGMTGRLLWCGPDDPPHRHDRVVFALDGGQLRYRDMRKLQGLRLVGGEDDVEKVLAGLGPDALSLGRRELDDILDHRRGALKPVLVDQEAIAGLGNLLADEILWRARVHPRYPARELPADARRRLHARIRSVLRSAVPTGQVPPRASWLTGVRDDPDPHCPRCGTALRSARVGGRRTVWCPHCQPAPPGD